MSHWLLIAVVVAVCLVLAALLRGILMLSAVARGRQLQCENRQSAIQRRIEAARRKKNHVYRPIVIPLHKLAMLRARQRRAAR